MPDTEAPWSHGPQEASFFKVAGFSLWRHPIDCLVCFPDQSGWFAAAQSAMSPGEYKDYLNSALDNRILFQSLLLSITMPASLTQGSIQNGFDAVIAIITFILTFFNTITVMACIVAAGIIGAVSESNFVLWATANKTLLHAVMSSQCILVPLSVTLTILSTLRALLDTAVFDAKLRAGILATLGFFVACVFAFFLFGLNVAGRSAAFSGAMGQLEMPGSSNPDGLPRQVFGATVGGHTVGLSKVREFFTVSSRP